MNDEDAVDKDELKRLQFIEDIERIRSSGLSYMEAIIAYHEEYQQDEYSVAELISKVPSIKAKLNENAEELNIIPKNARLPI